MAILSSLFGASQQQPAVGAQPITTTEIPTELKPYYTDILGKAQALYNKRVEEGFKPYEGPTIAEFTPEQQATFTGIAGLQGQVAPKFAEAEQLTRDAAAQITGAQLQEAMSPYQQAVTDIEKRESQKAFEQNVLPKIRAAQVAQGSFGGTRGTLLEAQALADQQRGLADIQAKGSAQAFRDARAALEAERTRMGQGATQLANIAPQALKTGLQELGAQQTVGELKQQQAQTALDEAYRQFLQEKQEPYEAMQKYQAVVTGAPLTTTQFAPPPAPGPSLGQTLLGGATTAAGLYGAFTGQNPLAAVGLMSKKKGGGIADALPLVKKDEGGRLARNFRAANRQGVLGLVGDYFGSLNPYEEEDVANRRGGLMEGRDPGIEAPNFFDFLSPTEKQKQRRQDLDMFKIISDSEKLKRGREKEVDDAIRRGDMDDLDTFKLKQQLRESDLAGEELARRIAKNKPNLQNVLRDPKGGKFVPDTSGITKSKPISKKYKGELQKIFEENERLKRQKENINQGTEQNLVAQNQTKTKPELTDFEKNIRTKEDALLKMLAGAEQRQVDRAAAAEKDATKSRYMQLANLGLGIMGATPEKNLLVTASKAAKDSKILENLQVINEKAKNAKQDAEDKAFAAKTGLAKEELGVELNREERDQVRKAKAAEKKFKDKQLALMEAELGLKERELELEAINSGVDAKDYKFLSDEVDKLTSQKGMVKVGDRNIPITSQTEALLPQEYRRQLGNIKNYALRLLQQSGTIDNLIAQDGLNAINNEIDRIYREGFSQIDTQSLGTAASGNLGANQ
jgi:hypothetical protein